jgi:hypothetical protein
MTYLLEPALRSVGTQWTHEIASTSRARLAKTHRIAGRKVLPFDCVRSNGLDCSGYCAPFLQGNPQFEKPTKDALSAMKQDGTLKKISMYWFGSDVTQPIAQSSFIARGAPGPKFIAVGASFFYLGSQLRHDKRLRLSGLHHAIEGNSPVFH